MRTLTRFYLLFCVVFFLASCGFHKPEIVTLPKTDKQEGRVLFIAIDGIGYGMMADLKKEGHFKDFRDPVPLIVTFPSATTTSFTGIFQPLNVGKVFGYESRFFSHKDNKVVGGTPFDVYRYPIRYKYYFDAFRHTMFEKAVMYSFPGVAGREDLERAEELALHSEKKILLSYLGGTDGAQHLLGQKRVSRFMKFVDRFIIRMKKRVEKKREEPLTIVLFSDHGFNFGSMKTVATGDIAKVLKKGGLSVRSHLQHFNDVVLVEYGLLNAGVMITQPGQKEKAGRLLAKVDGIDLVFWPSKNKVHILNSEGEEAFFQYEGTSRYRYKNVMGDPLRLKEVLAMHGLSPGPFIADKKWFQMTCKHYYPDPGYRLYSAFHSLVENEASVLFSLHPTHQFGSFAALAGTYLKFGHKGTHGALFWAPSAGMVMTDNRSIKLPEAIRYNEFFKIFLPETTRAYENIK